jgi:hypothetical protein
MDDYSTEQQIISLYDSNLVGVFSINEIAKRLGKPYPYINKKTNALVAERILNKIVVGRSYLCSINFENEKSILLLSLNEIAKKRMQEPKDGEKERYGGSYERQKEIAAYLARKSADITFHTVLVSGDHIIFVIEDLKNRLELQKQFSGCLVLDRKEFLNYLTETDTIFRHHIVLYGYERFFELLKQALPELKKKHSPLSY